MFFVIKMYSYIASLQRHVSTLAMSHLHVDQFFLTKVNHTISSATVDIVTYEIS